MVEPVSSEIKASRKGWFIVFVASLFFFYEFIQMNMFNAISTDLMRAFSIGATQLGELSSFYFFSNVIFLFVAGPLLDRYSTRWIMVVTLGICILGISLFSMTYSFKIAILARFLEGIGSAFCFLSVIRLASRWFPASSMAMMTGLIVTMAMLGGAVAQLPFAFLVKYFDWRQVIWLDAMFGLLIIIAIILIVRDYPSEHSQEHEKEIKSLEQIGYWKSLRLAFLEIKNWLAGVYTCLMNLPLSLLGGLWGILYLTDVHGFSKIEASNITTVLFAGTIIGSPIAGWISDKLKLRKLPMLFGALISLAIILWIIYSHAHSFWVLWVSFFLVGLLTSTQIVSYAYVAESSPRLITAMSVSAVNITTQAGQGIFQPLFGYLIDLHSHEVHYGMVIYTPGDFHWAMMLFPIGFILALMAAFALKETYGKQQEELPKSL